MKAIGNGRLHAAYGGLSSRAQSDPVERASGVRMGDRQ